MTSDSPARDFLLPRLTALVDEATGRGIARDVAVAVLIDLVTPPDFDTAAPGPADGDGDNPSLPSCRPKQEIALPALTELMIGGRPFVRFPLRRCEPFAAR